jgi:hypothetical protein
MTIITDETAEAARRRASLVTGLQDLAIFLATHPDTPLPVVHANFRVPAGPRGERLAFLGSLAELLGTQVTADGTGNLLAARPFGPVTAEGHVAPEDRSMTAWREAAARRAANAGSPAAA